LEKINTAGPARGLAQNSTGRSQGSTRWSNRGTAGASVADYARAEKCLAAAVNLLVVGGSVTVNRLPGERFWYRCVTPAGKSRVPAFDHGKLAAALATAAGAKIDPTQLPFQAIKLSADGTSVSFDYDRRR
jgi:hypothetical protein